MEANMRPHAFTVTGACRHYGVGKTKLYELIAANKIVAVKLGARTLIFGDSVEAHLASLPRLGAAALKEGL
jgi:excisionase family DNA binding protein